MISARHRTLLRAEAFVVCVHTNCEKYKRRSMLQMVDHHDRQHNLDHLSGGLGLFNLISLLSGFHCERRQVSGSHSGFEKHETRARTKAMCAATINSTARCYGL